MVVLFDRQVPNSGRQTPSLVPLVNGEETSLVCP
jgi:hypothetical protein